MPKRHSNIWRSRLVGRGRTTGNRVTVKSGSRVRISPSPPVKKDTHRVSFFTGGKGKPEKFRERIRHRRILFELTQSVSSEFESLQPKTPTGCPFSLAEKESRRNFVKEFGFAEFFLNSRSREFGVRISPTKTPTGCPFYRQRSKHTIEKRE